MRGPHGPHGIREEPEASRRVWSIRARDKSTDQGGETMLKKIALAASILDAVGHAGSGG